MITIDYTYYKNTYGGFLDEATFNKFVQRAYMSDESNYSEFQLSKIKTCVCAVTDKLNAVTGVDGTFSSGVTESETVGPWSVKYSTKSLPSSVYASLKELIFSYLSTTNLMVAWC